MLTNTQIIQLSYVLFLSIFGAFLRDLYLSSNPKTKEDEKLNLKRIFSSGLTVGIICFTFKEYLPLNSGMAFFGIVFLLGFASHYIVGLISNGKFLLKIITTSKGEIVKEVKKQLEEDKDE